MQLSPDLSEAEEPEALRPRTEDSGDCADGYLQRRDSPPGREVQDERMRRAAARLLQSAAPIDYVHKQPETDHRVEGSIAER